LDRKYDQQRQEAALRAQHQALLLHGLTEEQVQAILDTRKLFQQLTVDVPVDSRKSEDGQTPVYQVQELRVQRGQQVNAGDELALLTDHAQLLIEGNAFEKDNAALTKAVEAGAKVSASIVGPERESLVLKDLEILYLSGKVDPESRSLHFYVTLPNQQIRDAKNADGHRFIYWQFRPGQRVEIQVPVETWKERIVLPVDAIAQDGAETYVFQANGDHFDRRPVHVEYRDQHSVVIANDGSIFPGDTIAVSSAPQLQMAIKNKSGGGIDPHAGHSH
jgi:membrane fusion protein, heavy metal efflux system